MSGILNLPGLRELDKKESETEYHVKAEPAAIARLCPHCGELHRIQRHGNRPIYVRDLPTHGKTMLIHLDVPRLKCMVCSKTFTAVVPDVDEGFQMTERLVRWIGRQSLEYTYAELAKQVGIDEKSVRTIFDAYVAKLEKDFKRETPVWLGIDEIKLGRFRAIFTNIQDRALIDMLPDRYHTSIVRFLESLPNWTPTTSRRLPTKTSGYPEKHAYAAERQLILAMRKAGLELINTDDGGNGRVGVTIGPEQRERIRKALMGHSVSQETRERIGKAGIGRVASEAARARMSAKKLSPAHKAALMAAIVGRVVSEESRQKAREKMLGRTLTDEHKAKLREAHLGKKPSAETLVKRSIALRAAWARRKLAQTEAV